MERNKQYKKSKYNFIYKRGGDEWVVYNTYSKALIVLNDAEMHEYEDGSAFSDAQNMQAAVDNRILIDSDFNEDRFLRYCHYKTKFDPASLFLTIAPTMDCNFACPYCYENRRNGKMSEQVQDAIIDYTQEKINSGVKHVEISWYGGEPLLYFDILQRLAKKFIEITEKNNVRLTMDVVTNGYLLTKDIVDFFDEVKIRKVQITLDGKKEHHDVRRPLRNGEGTFDKIYENLKLFEDSPIKVNVRMNVDKENSVDYMSLSESIKALGNGNITLYPSPVEDLNKDTVNDVSSFMKSCEFEDFATGAINGGSIIPAQSSIEDNRYCFCNGETENAYVVDELGNFYKCWDQVGRQQYVCFNVLEKDRIEYKNIAYFLAWDPIEDEKCGKCVFLPLCFGGCKFLRMNNGCIDCGFSENSLKLYLEHAFFKDAKGGDNE